MTIHAEREPAQGLVSSEGGREGAKRVKKTKRSVRRGGRNEKQSTTRVGEG